MGLLEFALKAWTQAPLLAVIVLIVWLWRQQRKEAKNKHSYSVNLTAITYTAISFEQKRRSAEEDYVKRASSEAEELIEEFIVEMICNYRDDIADLVVGDENHSKEHMIRLYMGVYEGTIRKGFKKAMKDIVTIIKYNGLTSRSTVDFENYYAKRGLALFKIVISVMKKEYDNAIMPVRIDDRIKRFDITRAEKLSLDVFLAAREHRSVYEDRIMTLEKEEQEKLTEISHRRVNNEKDN